jgi:predicted nucleic acid-binding Zn finger protein
VPSCTGRGFYSVDYREETCDCPDFLRRGQNCKHILAVGVHVAKRRRHRPQACTNGVVYVGHVVEDPGTGEEVEVFEAVPCRRFAEEA